MSAGPILRARSVVKAYYRLSPFRRIEQVTFKCGTCGHDTRWTRSHRRALKRIARHMYANPGGCTEWIEP